MKLGKIIIQRQNIIKMNIDKSHVYTELFFADVVLRQNSQHYRVQFPYNTRKDASVALQRLRNNNPKDMPKPICKPKVFYCDKYGAVRRGWSNFWLALENKKSKYLS